MKQKNVDEARAVEKPEGVFRKTLSYNDDAMLRHALLNKGAQIPLRRQRIRVSPVATSKIKNPHVRL